MPPPLGQESGEQELGFEEGAVVTSCCEYIRQVTTRGLQVQVGSQRQNSCPSPQPSGATSAWAVPNAAASRPIPSGSHG